MYTQAHKALKNNIKTAFDIKEATTNVFTYLHMNFYILSHIQNYLKEKRKKQHQSLLIVNTNIEAK